MIRFFKISFLIFFFSACALPTVKNFKETQPTKHLIKNPYFSADSQPFIYKASVDFYGNTLSGILAVKQISSNKNRFAFTSTFGTTLLDVSFTPDSYTIHGGINKLKRKIIVRTLVNDLRTLLEHNLPITAKFTNANIDVLKTQTGKYYLFYFYQQDRLHKIVKTTHQREKLYILFNDFQQNVPKTITLEHQNFKLTIRLLALN